MTCILVWYSDAIQLDLFIRAGMQRKLAADLAVIRLLWCVGGILLFCEGVGGWLGAGIL